MDPRHLTRRTLLGIAMTAVAALTSFGGPAGAQNQNGGGLDDWGSKADFREWCDLIGGGWVDAPADGLTICVLPDGSREVCDQNGGNCRIYDRSAPPRLGRGRVVVDAGSVLVEANPGGVVPSRGVTAARVSTRLDRRDDDRP